MENSLTKDIFLDWVACCSITVQLPHEKEMFAFFVFLFFQSLNHLYFSFMSSYVPPLFLCCEWKPWKKIVNTGYEFVFKEYIFWELNKCHYSALLLKKIPPPVFNKRGPISSQRNQRKKGRMQIKKHCKLPKLSTHYYQYCFFFVCFVFSA